MQHGRSSSERADTATRVGDRADDHVGHCTDGRAGSRAGSRTGSHILITFPLGQHRLALLRDDDASLSLWLDGCQRKRRGAGGGPAYLWTNVELPFEDHHLVEIRRSDGAQPCIEISVNGTTLHRLQEPAAPTAPRESS